MMPQAGSPPEAAVVASYWCRGWCQTNANLSLMPRQVDATRREQRHGWRGGDATNDDVTDLAFGMTADNMDSAQ